MTEELQRKGDFILWDGAIKIDGTNFVKYGKTHLLHI